MSEPSWQREVTRFCRQYLQLEENLDFPQSKHLKLETVQHAICAKILAQVQTGYTPAVAYQVRMLKRLLTRIEISIDDWDEYGVSDDLATALSSALSVPVPAETAFTPQKSYVTYALSALMCPEAPGAEPRVDTSITLLESRSLIFADGTTGLRTWDAALHLGEFLCRNPGIVQGKRILELGAGTAYLSILCAKHLAAESVIASDGSESVVEALTDNFLINNLSGHSTCHIAAIKLEWGHALAGVQELAWNGGEVVDVVLGADIVYDSDLAPALITTLRELLQLFPRTSIFIATVLRNKETYAHFVQLCQDAELRVLDVGIQVPSREAQQGPFYNSETTIPILQICGAIT